jgi:hypothetical protein
MADVVKNVDLVFDHGCPHGTLLRAPCGGLR